MVGTVFEIGLLMRSCFLCNKKFETKHDNRKLCNICVLQEMHYYSDEDEYNLMDGLSSDE